MAADRVVVDVSALAGPMLPGEAAGNTEIAFPSPEGVEGRPAHIEVGQLLHVDRGQAGGGGQGLQG